LFPLQVANDPLTSISLVVVWRAVLGNRGDSREARDCCTWNVDVTSVLINNTLDLTVLVPAAAVKALDKACLGVTVTANEGQARSAKLMTLINAAGELAATIVIIKEAKAPKMSLTKVCIEHFLNNSSHGSSPTACGCFSCRRRPHLIW
jgi:hypothetical protein